MTEVSARRSALIALAILTVVWSFNWIVMKAVLVYVGALTFSAMRYVFGTVVLFAVLALRGENLAPTPWRDTLIVGLAQTTAFQALVQLALISGGAGKTALLAYTMPFWVIPLAWLVLGDRPSPRQWLYIALAAAGLVLVLQPWNAQVGMLSAVLALLGGGAWAVGTVFSKRLFLTTQVSPLRLTAWQMLYGTVLLVVIAACVHERETVWSPTLIGALLYNGILSSGLAWALWAFVVQRLPANVAGLASLSTPLLGVSFAWAILGERPDASEAIGIAVIGVALFGVLRSPARNARA
ncbi:MAG: EamA family transporter [Xanthomonadales bacterium PRO7]|jgi:drug/metabolite transporter (DMT)-like permease|nr:EamA family transporter [Xanthomonadales bacterium PRO7]HMM58046.1 DMT family transporter [Rudaea sp.]